MSAATSSRSSATSSRSASRSCATPAARTSGRAPTRRPRSACWTRSWARHRAPTTRDTFRRKLRAGELDDKEIEIEVAQGQAGMPMFELPNMPGASVGAISLGDIFGKAMGGRTKTRRTTVKDAYEPLVAEESDKLARPGADRRRGDPPGRGQRHRVPRRDRQDLRPREPRRRGRLPRGRPARPAAPDRGHHRRDQARPGEDRPRALHRVRRVPRLQAVRPPAGAAGPPADPGGAELAERGRFPPHPHRHRGEPGQAVRRPDGDRGRDARLRRQTPSTPSPGWPSR